MGVNQAIELPPMSDFRERAATNNLAALYVRASSKKQEDSTCSIEMLEQLRQTLSQAGWIEQVQEELNQQARLI